MGKDIKVISVKSCDMVLNDYKIFYLRDEGGLYCEEHCHDFSKLIFFIRGRVCYQIEGREYSLYPMDLIPVAGGVRHGLKADPKEPYERAVFYFSENFLKRHRSGGYDPGDCFIRAKKQAGILHFPPHKSAGLLALIFKLKEAACSSDYGAGVLTEALITELLVWINRGSREEDTWRACPSQDDRIAELLAYIDGHLAEELTVSALSARFFVSEAYLMRRFKMCTGETLHGYVIGKRLQYAKSLMAAGMNATDACYESGFQDYSTFLRACERSLGESPTGRKRQVSRKST